MIFPPRSFKSHKQEWRAWYAGSSNRILNYYNTLAFRSTNEGRFWGNLSRNTWQNVVHMPLAQDLCETSSNLLFSESPDFELPEGTAGERVEAFINDGFVSTLLESADMCAGLGGVYMKIDTDPDINDLPYITVRHPLQAFPKFKAGKLVGIAFKRLIKTEDKKKYYLIETRRSDGDNLFIDYELKKSSGDGFEDVNKSEAEELEEVPKSQVLQGVSGLGVVYVPNKLPNRLFLSSNEGVSDFQGVIGLLDSLDEVWTSWMRDIELGMSRILVDKSMIKDDFYGDDEQRFDPHERAFLMLDMDEWRMTEGNAKPIQDMQFDIRYDEHAKSAMDLTEQIISRAGYSPQSFGLNIEGRAESGTALEIRERKSMVTRQKKARYWQPAIEDLLLQVQEMDNATFLAPSAYEPQEVSVTLSDSIQDSAFQTSETLRNLEQAKAASTKVKVAIAHPDWTEEQVDEEVQRINEEAGAVMPEGMQFG